MSSSEFVGTASGAKPLQTGNNQISLQIDILSRMNYSVIGCSIFMEPGVTMADEVPNTRFVAVDFETSNASLASVCQIGIVSFEDGKVKESWGTLINPKDDFDEMNVSIHGIEQAHVRHAPTFAQVYGTISQKLSSNIVVSHTAFDRAVLYQTLAKYGLPYAEYRWLDSARVVRRTWDKWAQRGYGLTNVCRELKIEYRAHDAVEDARAAGEVLIRAMSETGLCLDHWMVRVNKPLVSAPIAMMGAPDGPLFGEELVFTGTLRIPRREAAAMAAKVGCNVAENVKKTTTLLVVGDQDVLKLAGHEKSIKHRKAEALIAKGSVMRILRESDFMQFAKLF
jgi:DNA polymerase-3 subunit epsilon